MKRNDEWIDKWNKLHIIYSKKQMKDCIKGTSECGMFYTFKPRPEMIGYRNNKMADYCEKMIVKAKEMYYNAGDIIMSDEQYDKFEEYLKLLRPDSKILEMVGYETK